MLRRPLSTYAGGSPRAISDGSSAQVFYFVDDATHDIATLAAALQECADYFENRADADCDQDGFIPNKEMQMLDVCKRALGEAK